MKKGLFFFLVVGVSLFVAKTVFCLETISVQWISEQDTADVKIEEMIYPKVTDEYQNVEIKGRVKNYSSIVSRVKLEVELNADDITTRELLISPLEEIPANQEKIITLIWKSKPGSHTFDASVLDIYDTLLDSETNLPVNVTTTFARSQNETQEVAYGDAYGGATGVNPYLDYYSSLSEPTAADIAYSPIVYAPSYTPFYGVTSYTTSDVNADAATLDALGNLVTDSSSILFGLTDFTGADIVTAGEADILSSYQGTVGFYSGGSGVNFGSSSNEPPIIFNDYSGEFNDPPLPDGPGDNFPTGEVPEPSTLFGMLFSLVPVIIYYRKRRLNENK